MFKELNRRIITKKYDNLKLSILNRDIKNNPIYKLLVYCDNNSIKYQDNGQYLSLSTKTLEKRLFITYWKHTNPNTGDSRLSVSVNHTDIGEILSDGTHLSDEYTKQYIGDPIDLFDLVKIVYLQDIIVDRLNKKNQEEKVNLQVINEQIERFKDYCRVKYFDNDGYFVITTQYSNIKELMGDCDIVLSYATNYFPCLHVNKDELYYNKVTGAMEIQDNKMIRLTLSPKGHRLSKKLDADFKVQLTTKGKPSSE